MLKATIQPSDPEFRGNYPTYYVEKDGVNVGPAGELILVAGFSDEDDSPTEFRIYAPGAWKEINVEQVND